MNDLNLQENFLTTDEQNESAINSIIKIRRLYNEPKIAFLLGDSTKFEDTSYASLSSGFCCL